jgi:membrane associated rhomboid family serine protease
MRRYPGYSGVSYAFGPGPVTPAVKIIIWANVALFLAAFFVRSLTQYLALSPQDVIERAWIWQLGTYMFLHGDVFHILFNMLGIWMFGVELERLWGTRYFVRYYAVSGLGGAAAMMLLALPAVIGADVGAASRIYVSHIIGASGALFGLLLAFGLYFPDRPILMMLLFPIPARYFVMIMGGISLLATIGASGGGVAHGAHLGGLVTGYLYLRGGRGGLTAEIKYRYVKWKMNRLRKKFDVYSGGRGPWDGRVH